jgi:serine/threonine protein kinase/Flp pilus assembly protein TadD
VSELIAEMAERWRHGDRPSAEEFFARYPELAKHPEAGIDIVYEEVCLRQDAGEEIDEAEIYRRFPQWRDQLEVLLRCDRLLAAAPPAPQFPAAGESLGEYRLLAELGRGTQGRVFLATQAQLDDRAVVLKITPRNGREHLSLARVQHTHIVPLYAVHDDPARNLRYICMPYLGGITLARALDVITNRSNEPRTGRQFVSAIEAESARQKANVGIANVSSVVGAVSSGRCPGRLVLESLSYIQAVCWVGACLADALDYAHERGLVHLDVKPSNVLLAADGQPMLLDFHLAQAPLNPQQPLPESLGGTSTYMAPEQRAALSAVSQGRKLSAPVDGRADVYALGVVLYEALGGPRPNERSSSSWTQRPSEPSIQTSAVASRNERGLSDGSRTAPQAFSRGIGGTKTDAGFPPLHRCNRQVSVELSDLIHKCLSHDPAARYARPSELAADLRRHLGNLPLKGIRTRSWSERWQKWRRRKPYVLPLSGMLLLLLIAAGAVALNSWASVRRQREQAHATLKQGREERLAGRYRAAMRTLNQGIGLAAGLPWAHDLRTELNNELELAYAEQAAWERAQALKELSLQADKIRFQASFNDIPPSRLQELEAVSRTWWARRKELVEGERDLALRERAKADLVDLAIVGAELCVRKAPKGTEAETRKDAMGLIQEAEAFSGGSPVLTWLRHHLNQATPLPAPPARTSWEACTIGRSLLTEGQFEAARPYLEQAVRLQPQELWPNFYFGICCYEMGRWEEALAAFTACVALAPESAVCFYNRALAYAALNRADKAEGDYDAALQRDPSLSAAALNRGILHFRAGRYAQAIADLERSLRDGSKPAVVYYNLALVYKQKGDPVRALANVEAALNADPDHSLAKALAESLRNRE